MDRLNTYGQLGLGDFKTRFTPALVKIPNVEDNQISIVKKPMARKHHSACLLSTGVLMTWGSAQGSLGHGEECIYIYNIINIYIYIYICIYICIY